LLTSESPYHQRFLSLLDQIRDEIEALNKEIRDLKKENNRLKSKIEEIQDGQTDIYSAMAESERMALRNKIQGLITKIDSHLEDEA